MAKYYFTTQGEHVTWYEKVSSGEWEFRNWSCGSGVSFEYDPERDTCICVWDHLLSRDELDVIMNGSYPFQGVVGLVYYLPNIQMGEASVVDKVKETLMCPKCKNERWIGIGPACKCTDCGTLLERTTDEIVRMEVGALQSQVGGSHYKDMRIQPLEFNIANNIPFAEGNVIKYVCRWRKKGGVEDLKKAIHILQVLVEMEEKKDVT